MRIHRVYSKSLSAHNEIFQLDEPQSHHLIKALRIKENDIVEVFDGRGNVANCLVLKLSNKICSLQRTESLKKDRKPKNLITGIIPIIKKNNFNFMLQKMTEVGVNRFLVYQPDNIDQSVAKKDKSIFIEKSKEIVISVCKQCGNNFLPKIESYIHLQSAVDEIQKEDQIFAFDTEASKYFAQDELDMNKNITIITGPESGFSNKELNILRQHTVMIRFLGKNILRSETAPIVVAAIIKNHFGKIEK